MQTVGALLLVALIAMPLEAQKGKGKCTGLPADSVELSSGSDYRNCDVDRPARLRGNEPRINFQPSTPGVPRSRCAGSSAIGA